MNGIPESPTATVIPESPEAISGISRRSHDTLVQPDIALYHDVMGKSPCVYMLASRAGGVLYVGVTSDLPKRAWEHRNHLVSGFTKKYGVDRLVWYEQHDAMVSAISREKAIKRWRRGWKVALIEEMNPEWRDLFNDFVS